MGKVVTASSGVERGKMLEGKVTRSDLLKLGGGALAGAYLTSLPGVAAFAQDDAMLAKLWRDYL